MDQNLSMADVGRAVGLHASSVSRIERGLWSEVPIVHLFRIAEAVGLEVALRAYPGGDGLRDTAHAALVDRFAARLAASLRWGTEVPLPIQGDRRAWDGLVAGPGWRYGVEVETGPNDAQALIRRLAVKQRDGDVDGIILVVPDTRRVRDFLAAAGSMLLTRFPVAGRIALERLGSGQDPGGSAIVRLVRPRPQRALRRTQL
jgi:transcriptional regulator with XRE-family HTH domain